MNSSKLSGFQVTAAAVVLLLFAAGCGSGVMTLKAKYPDNPSKRHPPTQKTVLVKVTDARRFQAHTSSITQPTYSGAAPSDQEKVRIIGAKSGEGGKDFAGIYLDETQTVKSIVSDLMRVALEYAGYKAVTTAEQAEGEPDIVADVSIFNFWVWMIPGTMTISVLTDIQIEASMESKDGGTLSIKARGFHEDPDVSKSRESYRFALNEALNHLLINLQDSCIDYVSESMSEKEAGYGF